jgi:hypothetical protein
MNDSGRVTDTVPKSGGPDDVARVVVVVDGVEVDVELELGVGVGVGAMRPPGGVVGAKVVVVTVVESARAADGAKAINPTMPTLANSPVRTAYRLLKRRRISVDIYLSRKRQTKRPTQTMSTKCQ